MTEPLFVLSTFKVKEGRVDDVKKHYRRILDIIEPNEPQLIAFHGFLSEDETEMTSIQVHPDTDSMEFHMQVLKDNWDALFSEYGEMLEGTTERRHKVLFGPGAVGPAIVGEPSAMRARHHARQRILIRWPA